MKRYPEGAWERAMKVQDVMRRDGEEDYLVAGGGDHRHIGPEPTALAVALRAVWLRRAVRPAAREAQPEAGAGGDGRRS